MYNLNQTQQQQQPAAYYPVNRPIYQAMPYAGLKGRPVASIEEARASIIDFDGSIFYFPDLANKRIYTKQINMDGTAVLNMYELKEIPVETSPVNAQYVTREEFEAAIRALSQNSVTVQKAPESVPQQPASKPAAAGVPLNF